MLKFVLARFDSYFYIFLVFYIMYPFSLFVKWTKIVGFAISEKLILEI